MINFGSVPVVPHLHRQFYYSIATAVIQMNIALKIM